LSSWDAVVVGGGPAGSSMAARLASAGHRTLLLDREGFPRAKACGECLNPGAVDSLERLGVLDQVLAAPHVLIPGWSVHAPGGESFQGRFPDRRQGIAISRLLLDSILLENARRCGAEVRTGVRVTGLIQDRGAIVGVRAGHSRAGESITARLVVGADGLRSVVARRLELIRRRPVLRKLALTAHVRGLHPPDRLGHLHLFTWGCIGVAEVGGGVSNVTVVVGDRSARHIAGRRDRFFDDVLRSTAFLQDAERDGRILATGPFDWPIRRAVADGAILVGDAAGYFDPFTGQGIFRALHGAELASRAAHVALAAGDPSAAALSTYERARRRAFSAKVALQHAIEAVVSRPRLIGAVSGCLSRAPVIADALVRVTGDLDPLRALAAPRIAASALASLPGMASARVR
jgi:menaquinone-9 beta-reductase